MPYVHLNAERSLAVMPCFLQKKFGVNSIAGGTCMIAQVSYVVWSQTGIPIKDIVKHIDGLVPREVGLTGHTLSEIVNALCVPIFTDGRYVTLDFELHEYHTMPALVKAIIHGYPVITVLPSVAFESMNDELNKYGDGEVVETTLTMENDGRFHAVLGIGFDARGLVVFRESRHLYCHHGFIKIGVSLLSEAMDIIFAFSLTVTDAVTCHPTK